jgi:hypothetical protein
MVSRWAEMQSELLVRILDQAGWIGPGGLRFSTSSAVFRAVCASWRAMFDARVERLALRQRTTDGVSLALANRFPLVGAQMNQLPSVRTSLIRQWIRLS